MKNSRGDRVVYVPYSKIIIINNKVDEVYGEVAYWLIELVILSFLAYNLINIWAFLPCNL